jgi:tRNA (guanine37-N1)-methyltransferase
VPLCVNIDKSRVSDVLEAIKKAGLLSEEFKIMRSGDHVLIPIKAEHTDVMRSLFRDLLIVECSPPRRRIPVHIKMPSLDYIGDVVIVRRNVLDHISTEDLINRVRVVYPRVRAIWVKEETCNLYRKPMLRLLWGEEIKEVVVKEYGVLFKVKLGDVYYNSRLAKEHYRVATMIKSGEVVLDAFSGIGGFTLHIATLKPSLVIANDLNPIAYELLVENILLNKRRLKGSIIPLNTDTRELPGFLREHSIDRIIADLPHQSLEYIEVYTKLLKPGGLLHLYVLLKLSENIEQEIRSTLGTWYFKECVSVLEYSPGVFIYRCDLVKPKTI